MRNRNDMRLGGWIINAHDQDEKWGGSCDHNTFWGYDFGESVGFVEAIFKGSGIGTLNFGNCFWGGITKVFLNGQQISSAAQNQNSVVARFNYKSGDILKIAEERQGIIQINSLLLEACNILASA